MKLKKIRNALLVVLSLALVSAATVAITWAAATSKDLEGSKDNEFTNNPDISLQFQELTFDDVPWGETRTATDDTVPSGETDTEHDPTLPDGTKIEKGKDLGYNLARSYTANQVIPKNPQLKNNTDTTHFLSSIIKPDDVTADEWVALGVKYKMTIPDVVYAKNDGDSHTGADAANAIAVTAVDTGTSNTAFAGDTITFDSYADFATAIAKVEYAPGSQALTALSQHQRTGTTEDTDTWKDISTGSKGTLFMYNKKLAVDGETKTLFDAVHINNVARKYVSTGSGTLQLYELQITAKTSATTNNQLTNKYIYVTALPQFDIQLTGYAVQADNVAYADAPEALRGFAASVA